MGRRKAMNNFNQRMSPAESGLEDRREFLKKCGKYAVVTPPVMTALLTRSNKAVASGDQGEDNNDQGGGGGGNGNVKWKWKK
jgi:hypothetical protein